jgi:5-formyltetrahydrofolate cyclo-ligase
MEQALPAINSTKLKRTLRHQARERRGAIDAAMAASAARSVAKRVLALLAPPPLIIALYAPLRGELDVGALVDALHARGDRLALPVVAERSGPLVFRAYRPGDPLVTGLWGIDVPAPEQAELRPDVVIAPLLAFDRALTRLGNGGGYYDRTLAALRARGRVLAIGVAFASQEIAAVPRESFDQRLDVIVTENETILPREAAR